MRAPTTTRVHHVALTVTNLDVSVRWYESVLGLHYIEDIPHADGAGTGKLLGSDDTQVLIALHQHDTNPGAPFTETNTGLDHLSLKVASPDSLEAWQLHLEANGIAFRSTADRPLTHSAIATDSAGRLLVFRDPDNIQLELYADATTH